MACAHCGSTETPRKGDTYTVSEEATKVVTRYQPFICPACGYVENKVV